MGFGNFISRGANNFASRWQAHPFQQLMGLGAGMLGGPLAGQGVSRAFQAYDNHNFNNAFNQAQQNTVTQGNQAMQQGMNAPLNGPLGQFDGTGGGNAFAGAQAGGGLGGLGGMQGPGGGWNMSQLFGQSPAGVNGLLDFLGQAPQGPQGSFFSNPAYAPNQGGGNGGGGMGGGMQGGSGGFGGNSLPGGGNMNVMNGASSAMARDFQPLFVRRQPGARSK